VAVYIIDPLTDARWDELLLRHRRASVFHTRGWLSALQRTYRYNPVVYTTSAPGERLENGVVFCDVRSFITGRRLVSLPFSDHCDPLVNSPAEQADILAHVREHIGRMHCKYAEMRPLSAEEPKTLAAIDLRPSEKFYLHMLSLDPPLEVLLRDQHKDCIQRKVRRAEREGLSYEKGRSESSLRKFYQLLLRTRRRQGLPPQPLQWFRHLIVSIGDQLTIRVASKGDRPVAAILTLSFKNTITYKYGCSDERFNRLGGTPFLFWKTIQEAKDQGMSQLDLGRSELDNAGLLKFKERLGANRMELQYYCLVPTNVQAGSWQLAAGSELPGKGLSAWRMAIAPKMVPVSRRTQFLRRFVCHIPDPILVAAGRLLYRHIG
jgi:CelD/BcsL family acetyltransferase involved in cellulose biosynthesis